MKERTVTSSDVESSQSTHRKTALPQSFDSKIVPFKDSQTPSAALFVEDGRVVDLIHDTMPLLLECHRLVKCTVSVEGLDFQTWARPSDLFPSLAIMRR